MAGFRSMPPADVPQPERARWSPDDLAFAIGQLSQENPGLPRERVTEAVTSAAPFTPTEEGRVQLMRRARNVLRSSAGHPSGH